MKSRIKNFLCVANGEIGVWETLAYTLGTFGKTMIYAMANIYLMIFYTDVLCVDSTQIAIMFLISKIFDAINDFIMGTIVDRTRTRFGKMRPYFLLASVPLALMTTLMFSQPHTASENGKIIYMYVTYILWGVAYTIFDVPYSGMASVITTKNDERTKLITIANMFGSLGNSFPFLLIPLLMDLKNKNSTHLIKSNADVYLFSAIIFGVFGAVSILICFAKTKERVPQNNIVPSFKESASYLVHNKPLLLVMLSVFLAFPRSLQGIAQTYVATYLLGGAEKILILGIPMVIGTLIGYFFVPIITKKFGNVKTYKTFIILSFIPFTIEYFIYLKNIPALIIFSFLFAFSIAPINVITPLLIADCIDYTEWQTGQRTEGISYSVQTFINKVVSAFQSFLLGMILTLFNYVEPQTINGVLVEQIQSAHTLQGIWATYTIIPSLCSVLTIIPMLFYPLKDNKMNTIREKLKERRNNNCIQK